MFVAVWPSVEVVDCLKRLDRLPRGDMRWTTPEQWHVTLSFLGNDASAECSKAALEQMDFASLRGALAEVGPATACFGRHVLYLPVGGLSRLASCVREAVPPAGHAAQPATNSFTGHLTLARARGRTGDLRALAGMRFSATWPVNSVTLVASTLAHTGARYEVVASIPFPAPDVLG